MIENAYYFSHISKVYSIQLNMFYNSINDIVAFRTTQCCLNSFTQAFGLLLRQLIFLFIVRFIRLPEKFTILSTKELLSLSKKKHWLLEGNFSSSEKDYSLPERNIGFLERNYSLPEVGMTLDNV